MGEDLQIIVLFIFTLLSFHYNSLPSVMVVLDPIAVSAQLELDLHQELQAVDLEVDQTASEEEIPSEPDPVRKAHTRRSTRHPDYVYE